MSSDPSIWFRLGYALERARSGRDAATERGERRPKTALDSSARDAGQPAWPSADDLITSGLTALAAKLLDAWRPARRVSLPRLLWAGAAGAGAAFMLELLNPLLRGHAEVPEADRETGARILAGVGQGLLYGAVVEPRLPGPAVVKGVTFGLAQYLAHPAGGLTHLLGAHTPQGRLPIVADLLGEVEPAERDYIEHLVFATALAVLYGETLSEGDVDG